MPLIHDCVPPFGKWDFHVFIETDWDDPLPQFLDAAEDPYDLTGVDLHLWVRPTWDHSTLMIFASTTNGLISILSPATDGLANIHVEQATLAAVQPGRWRWFLQAEGVDYYREFGRGDFYLHPGRT